MIGIHIDSTATKPAIRRRPGIASNLQLSSKGKKDKSSINKGNNTAVDISYESPLKRKLTATDINS